MVHSAMFAGLDEQRGVRQKLCFYWTDHMWDDISHQDPPVKCVWSGKTSPQLGISSSARLATLSDSILEL